MPDEAAVVRFDAPGSVSLVSEPARPLGPSDVRVRTLYSGISAGTELATYQGTSPYLGKSWDPGRRLFVTGEAAVEEPATDYPVIGIGYEEVGEVVEVGEDVRAIEPGRLVWGTWGHRSETVLPAAHAAARVLAPETEPIVGIFSHIGAVALNVVLDADIHVGENVVVFGLGVPGQLVAQLARLNGARVIAVDSLPQRLAIARELGADEVLEVGGAGSGSGRGNGGAVAERIRDLTGNRGADVALEVSGSYRALHEAVRSVAYSSRVVAAGFFQGEGLGLFLGEEFHHNRIDLLCSQISGVSPALAHRWDRDRLNRTIMDLAETGRLRLQPLVSHVLPASEVSSAFELLTQRPGEVLQVVLSF